MTNTKISSEEHYLRRELYKQIQTDPLVFDFLQQGSLDGIWYWDLEKPENEWLSPRFKEVFGYADKEMADSSEWWQTHINPEDKQVWFERFEAHIRGETPYVEAVVRYPHKDGSTVWVNCRGVVIRDKEGKPIRMLGAHTNVTALKQAEQRLESEQRLLRKLLEKEDRERKLVANEIHDGFVQYAVGAHMQLETALSRMDWREEKLQTSVATAAMLLERAIDDARRLIGGLRPMIVDERGLVAAIEHLVSDRSFCQGLDVRFTNQMQDERLDPVLEATLLRIVQEAVNNAKRHSGSDRAAVRIRQQEDRLLLEIEDWGKGFDADHVPAERFGLRGIRERARLFGGDASIISSVGKGTTIVVTVPISPVATH